MRRRLRNNLSWIGAKRRRQICEMQASNISGTRGAMFFLDARRPRSQPSLSPTDLPTGGLPRQVVFGFRECFGIALRRVALRLSPRALRGLGLVAGPRLGFCRQTLLFE